MHGTHKPYLTSHADGHASPGNIDGLTRTLSYPSTSQAGMDAGGHSLPAVGLGIFQGGLDIPYRQLREDRPSDSMQPSFRGCSNHPISNQSFSSPTLSASGYVSVPPYQSYSECQAVHSSFFSGITPQGMAPSLSYSPDVQVKENDVTIYRQSPGAWPMTPQSPSIAKQRMNPPWGAHLSHMAFFSDAHSEEQPPRTMQRPDIPALDSQQTGDMSGKDRLVEVDPNRRSFVEASISLGPSSSSGRKCGKKSDSSAPSNVEYRCRVCGHEFSRRSNCNEHERRHDPNYRRQHTCTQCGGTFGRKTDLRRHFISVSQTFLSILSIELPDDLLSGP
jgi:hypothetical protein